MSSLRIRVSLGVLALAVVPALPAFAQTFGCPKDQSSGELALWRNKVLEQWSGPDASLVFKIESCFPGGAVPACLDRLYQTSISKLRRGLLVETPEERNIKLLPDEFRVSDGDYRLYTGSGSTYKDIEQIAKERGWPMVRYKTRHSGGFDTETSALLMIRIPGKSLNPPVDYDRYVNIALPEDPGQAKETNIPDTLVSPVPLARIPRPEELELDPPRGGKYPAVFTIVAVRRPQPGGGPAQVYFNKFIRSGSTFRSNGDLHVLQSCYSCHPNGLREISPLGFNVRQAEVDRGQMMPEAMWKAVEEMNNSMKSNSGYAVMDWGKTRGGDGRERPSVNPAGYWPIYGAIKPMNRDKGGVPVTRTREFILGGDGKSGCAFRQPGWMRNANDEWNLVDVFGRAPGSANIYRMSASPSIRWEKVAEAMRCGSCHDNKVHGALNERTDRLTIAYKILVDQSMPPLSHTNPYANGGARSRQVKDELTGDERIALTNCLMDEFEQEKRFQKAWFTQVACTDNRAETGPSASTALGTSLPGSQLIDSLTGAVGGASAQSTIPDHAISRSLGNRSPAVVPNPSPSASAAPASGAGGHSAVSGH